MTRMWVFWAIFVQNMGENAHLRNFLVNYYKNKLNSLNNTPKRIKYIKVLLTILTKLIELYLLKAIN